MEQVQNIMGSQNMNCQRQMLLVLYLKNPTQYLPRQMADMELEMCNSANIAEEIVDAVATEASNDKEEEEVVNKMNNTQMINMLTKQAKLFYSL